MRCRFSLPLLGLAFLVSPLRAADPWVVYEGADGPGKGKHVVLISGDEEYRSEEALPQLGKILATRHGFKCTVLFAIDPKTGLINPNVNNNIPGLDALRTADLMIVFTRFRNLPDDQMKFIDEYLESGKPVIGLRTATHGFNLTSKKYEKYHWKSKVTGYEDGFGRQVLGETWVNHHGKHGSQATRGIINPEQAKHPILKGIKDGEIFGPSDVYEVRLPLPGDSKPLVFGQVVDGMKPEDKALEGKKNDPMMPVAWVKNYQGESGKSGKVFTTTMGASQDLLNEGVRRLIVNAAFWAVGLEEKIGDQTNVELVGDYKPTRFQFFKEYKATIKPEELK